MSTYALDVSNLQKSYGLTKIIQGLSVQIEAGERHAIIGPNGAGKTTLFNLISGRTPPTGGKILLNGKDITGLDPHQINRRGLSRSFQVTSLFHRLSTFENLRCALLWSQGYRYSFWNLLGTQKKLNAEADMWLDRLHLRHRRDVQAGLLSYAEQRALEIGMTIAGGAQVVLLDEPTAGMSSAETEQAVNLIREVTAGRTLLMVEHDMGVVFGLADRISVLVAGQIIATDIPARIRENADVQHAYLGQMEAA